MVRFRNLLLRQLLYCMVFVLFLISCKEVTDISKTIAENVPNVTKIVDQHTDGHLDGKDDLFGTVTEKVTDDNGVTILLTHSKHLTAGRENHIDVSLLKDSQVLDAVYRWYIKEKLDSDDSYRELFPTKSTHGTSTEFSFLLPSLKADNYVFKVVAKKTESAPDTLTVHTKAIPVDAPKLVAEIWANGVHGKAKTEANFSSTDKSIYFDPSSESYQFPGTGTDDDNTFYRVDSVTGGSADDRFYFENLEADDTFTVNGGSGENIIDLSKYTADNVSITNESGTKQIRVTLKDSGTATINYAAIQKFVFSTNIFDGTPHGFTLVAGNWKLDGKTLEAKHSDGLEVRQVLTDYAGTLDKDFELSVGVTLLRPESNGLSYNGGIIYNYSSKTDHKAAVLAAGKKIWGFERPNSAGDGTVIDAFSRIDSSVDLSRGTTHEVTLKVTGDLAELYQNGEQKIEKSYSGQALNEGSFGVATYASGLSRFELSLKPSNWAPYVPVRSAKMNLAEKTLEGDLLAGVKDPEGTDLTAVLDAEVEAKNGSVTIHDGHFDFIPQKAGSAYFDYKVGDGSNITKARYHIKVVDFSTFIAKSSTAPYELKLESLADGIDTEKVTITGLPADSRITDTSDSTRTAQAPSSSAAEAEWTIPSSWDLEQIKIEPPMNFKFDSTNTYTITVKLYSKALDDNDESSRNKWRELELEVRKI